MATGERGGPNLLNSAVPVRCIFVADLVCVLLIVAHCLIV